MPKISTVGLRSDSLQTLRPLFETVPMLRIFEGLAQLTLIIDANIILGDILWLTRKRTNPAAHTELFELLKAQTICAIAPTYLLDEMAAILVAQATKRGLDLKTFEDIWRQYQGLITFIDTGGPDVNFSDPKDAPYIKLQHHTGTLIYSRDSDIQKMGGHVVSTAILASLRIYSRQVVIEYTLKAGGTGCVCVSFGLARLMIQFIRSLASSAQLLPKRFWLYALMSLFCLLLYPPSRRYISSFIQSLSGKAKELGQTVLAQFSELVIEHESAKKNAAHALDFIKTEFSHSPIGAGLRQSPKKNI